MRYGGTIGDGDVESVCMGARRRACGVCMHTVCNFTCTFVRAHFIQRGFNFKYHFVQNIVQEYRRSLPLLSMQGIAFEEYLMKKQSINISKALDKFFSICMPF